MKKKKKEEKRGKNNNKPIVVLSRIRGEYGSVVARVTENQRQAKGLAVKIFGGRKTRVGSKIERFTSVS